MNGGVHRHDARESRPAGAPVASNKTGLEPFDRRTRRISNRTIASCARVPSVRLSVHPPVRNNRTVRKVFQAYVHVRMLPAGNGNTTSTTRLCTRTKGHGARDTHPPPPALPISLSLSSFLRIISGSASQSRSRSFRALTDYRVLVGAWREMQLRCVPRKLWISRAFGR